tara:strand:+ start:826 stop:1455 length:630 start_codon:yes stop_codon:yes gene_type:complete
MVIDPSITHPEVESFNKIVEECPYPCTYHLPVMSDIDSISRSLSSSCGIIILGSAASVHDQSDWQSELASMLFKAIESEIPILGICFGHQFLAHHLGGRVDYLWNKSKREGIREIYVKNSSLIDSNENFNLIYSHQEGVVECPNNFYVSASSELVDIEAINHNSKAIWGFQTHIEASFSFANRHGISYDEYETIDRDGMTLMKSFFDKI